VQQHRRKEHGGRGSIDHEHVGPDIHVGSERPLGDEADVVDGREQGGGQGQGIPEKRGTPRVKSPHPIQPAPATAISIPVHSPRRGFSAKNAAERSATKRGWVETSTTEEAMLVYQTEAIRLQKWRARRTPAMTPRPNARAGGKVSKGTPPLLPEARRRGNAPRYDWTGRERSAGSTAPPMRFVSSPARLFFCLAPKRLPPGFDSPFPPGRHCSFPSRTPPVTPGGDLWR